MVVGAALTTCNCGGATNSSVDDSENNGGGPRRAALQDQKLTRNMMLRLEEAEEA